MHVLGRRHLGLLAAFAAMPYVAPAAAHADLLTTRAGTGTAGALGEGVPAPAAQLDGPRGLARLGDGSILVADTGGDRIRRIAPDGTITTVAGTGTAGDAGDGGPADRAELDGPRDVAVAPDGLTFYIADTGNDRVRAVAPDGTITAVGGAGARLDAPSGISVAPDGRVLIADTGHDRVRVYTPADGRIGPAPGGRLDGPQDVSATADGGYLIADTGHHAIRRVDAAGTTITTVAGTGAACAATLGAACGDFGPAGAAALREPTSVSADASGTGFLIADTGDHRVRRVSGTGTITTVAGSGVACASPALLCGDAGPAALARLNAPGGALALPDGTLLVADTGDHRLRARIPDPLSAAETSRAASVSRLGGAPGLDQLTRAAASTLGPVGAARAAPTGAPLAIALARAARPAALRVTLSSAATVVVRVKLGPRTLAARRLTFHAGGPKRLPLKPATYAVTTTATDGATDAIARTTLRVPPAR